MSGTLRVIAGAFGGRTLKAPRGLATRPTSARVREALFAVLGDLSGMRVLDLHAGSGALAIEALSRGASHALLVEHDRAAVACIRENLRALGLDERAALLPRKIAAAAGEIAQRGPFDLILCDPPWPELDRAVGELERLVAAGVLASDGRLSLEHAAKGPEPEIERLAAYDRRRWGDTGVSLFQAAPASGRQT
ncbi:MAG TPA: 16S rRNA (guanine(966)-N(2))-methyltransferase RsmD [Polyangiaceae bacterium]